MSKYIVVSSLILKQPSKVGKNGDSNSDMLTSISYKYILQILYTISFSIRKMSAVQSCTTVFQASLTQSKNAERKKKNKPNQTISIQKY